MNELNGCREADETRMSHAAQINQTRAKNIKTTKKRCNLVIKERNIQENRGGSETK